MGVIDEAVDRLTTKRARKRLVSAATPLHSGVPAKIREKIWANEYVDFRVRVLATDSEDFIFVLSSGKTAMDLTLQEWLSAWDKFSQCIQRNSPRRESGTPPYSKI